jgi:hypothetical protein
MQPYRLVFQVAAGEAHIIEFEAENAASALAVARQRSSDRSAELWEHDRKLCDIKRLGQDEDSYWAVFPAPRSSAITRA